MRRLICDAHGALLRGVRDILESDPRLAGMAGCVGGLPQLTVSGAEAEPWASATFSGRRHVLELTLRGTRREVEAAKAAIAERLPGADFDVRGHFVAGVAVTGAKTRRVGGVAVCEMRFEALTIEA